MKISPIKNALLDSKMKTPSFYGLIIKLEPSDNKKYKATFDDNSVVFFGAKDYEDYTIHKDYNRKIRYMQRHQYYYTMTKDIKAPSILSLFILWNFTSLKKSMDYYNKTVHKLYMNGEPIPANPELLAKVKKVDEYIKLCDADNIKPYLTNFI